MECDSKTWRIRMHTLTGKDDNNDLGCLFSVGIVLLFTLFSLSPLLSPAILSTEWYSIFSLPTSIFLLLGLLFTLFPFFSDQWTRLMLAFILLSCTLLQLSTFQLFTNGAATSVMRSTWNIHLRIIYALFLIGFFILTSITHFHRLNKTTQNISLSSLSISEHRLTIGKEFLIRYHLACAETTPIKSVRITFAYQQHEGFSLNAGGYPGYAERTLPIYEKKNFLINPPNPFVEELPWTIPTSLIPEEGPRKDWTLKVRLAPRKGIIMETTYPLKVKWAWPDQDP